MKKSYSKLFVILLIINIVVLLSCNIISSKPFSIWLLTFTSGDFLFPITYILNDVFVEVYGYEKSKFTIKLSFVANILMVLIFYIAIILPYPSYYIDQQSFQKILSFTPRLLLASMAAYYFGNISNSIVMSKMKEKNSKQKLWIRTVTSSIIGEVVDTIVFVTISFAGVIKSSELIIMIISVYILKITIEIVFTPVLLKLINKINKIERGNL